MRVVIDVLGAPADSGGMRLYAEQLLRAWAQVAPDDHLVVVGAPWVVEVLAGHPSASVHVVPEGFAARALGQWVRAGVVARRSGADALLSVSPLVSPFAGPRPQVCIAHDWRHVRHPEEFPRHQRLYRRLWAWSATHATRSIQISAKTDAETARIAPRARRVTVENGQDHPRTWPPVDPEPGADPFVVTYGHHANKRPDLVIRALRVAHERLGQRPRLVVLGAGGGLRERLRRTAVAQGVGAAVDFPGYVATSVYQELIQRAGLVVLASSDEGFGLPVAEARYFGIPVLSTDDSGLAAIHGDRVVTAAATPGGLGTAMAELLSEPGRRRPPATVATWADTARGIRDVLAEAAAQYVPAGQRR
ncbi:glycosyltransferase [Nocardioides carbamazepini]|uniref:glycosyltransferase n=1 Tax=Nocardioides carbamazepini TaxID=2854259 RepID=UPI00214A37AD|nr:glycosyltransferase [Nocardioides carbamazepini]MCR1786230.1 glycosyltransferase [Nocardioides carbamazepini]